MHRGESYTRLDVPDVTSILQELKGRYPSILTWYEKTIRPNMFDTVRVSCASVKDVLVGIAIADVCTNKLCTLYVREGFRNRGIGSSLLSASLTFLGNLTPYFTCAENCVRQYDSIILRYNWTHSHTGFPSYISADTTHNPEWHFNLKHKKIRGGS